MQKNKDVFSEYKKQVIENLKCLQDNLGSCEEIGMLDEHETIYNEIVDLLDEARGSETISDLSEIITNARVIETNIDSWLSNTGISNTEIIWPQI